MSEHIVEWIRREKPTGILWLASYPRSGVTMARMMLAQCFGLITGTEYDEPTMTPEYHAAVKSLGANPQPDRIYEILAAQKILPIKTHALPVDDGIPAIVIARDGRRVCDSLLAFYQSLGNDRITMRDVITGAHRWGRWSHWVSRWGQQKKDVVWLTHEQMVSDPKSAIDGLADMWGIEPISYELPQIGKMRQADPIMFRTGKTDGRGAMTDEDERLFWKIHRDAMIALGYGEGK